MTQLLLMSLQQQSELGVKWPAPPCFQVAENWCCDQSCPCFHRGRWTCRVLKDSAKSLAVPSGFDAPPVEDYIGPYQTLGTPKKKCPSPSPTLRLLYTSSPAPSPCCLSLWYPCQWHAWRTPHCKGCCDQSWALCEHSPPMLLPAGAVTK